MNQNNSTGALVALNYKLAFWILGVAVMLKDKTGNLVFNDGSIKTLQTNDVIKLKSKEKINMAKYTKKQLEGKTSNELVEIYNKANKKDPVTKFASKAAGIKRILAKKTKAKVNPPKGK